MKYSYDIKVNSDSSLLIHFKDDWSLELSEYIYQLSLVISKSELPNLIEPISAYSDILVIFLPLNWLPQNAEEQLLQIIHEFKFSATINTNVIEIPVCYDYRLADDLEPFLENKNIQLQEFVALHSNANYRVEMLGFLPGFLYLSGLHNKLNMPRKSTPSLSVPKGSIAIGGNQTGIYPISSPGGWHIVGRTPLELFDLNSIPPNLAKPMDRIKFTAICYEEYLTYEY